MAKQKHYRLVRIAKMLNCVSMMTEILAVSQKRDLDLIDLTFLKKIEQRLQDYHKTLDVSSRIPIKKGKTTE